MSSSNCSELLRPFVANSTAFFAAPGDLDQLEQPRDRIEWGSESMAHDRQELALGTLQCLVTSKRHDGGELSLNQGPGLLPVPWTGT